MSSSIIFNKVLVNGAEVLDTRSTANKHTYFCEEDECGNETHSDNKCDSCRAALIAYASGAYKHTCSGEIDYETGTRSAMTVMTRPALRTAPRRLASASSLRSGTPRQCSAGATSTTATTATSSSSLWCVFARSSPQRLLRI